MAFHTFHINCGKCITLSNNDTSATRSINDFNHGLVIGAKSLIDNILFEIQIDKIVKYLLQIKEIINRIK